MFKAGKTGLAIVIGLLLSLTLLTSGAFAQDTTTAQNSASTGSNTHALVDNTQQGAQVTLLASSVRPLNAGQSVYHRYWRPIRFRHFRHYWRPIRFRHYRFRHFRRYWRPIRFRHYQHFRRPIRFRHFRHFRHY